MFVSRGQFFVFIACVAFGGVCGILFSAAGALKFFVKNKIVKNLFDFITFLLVCFLYFIFAYKMRFPNFRFYMVLGVFLGIFMYIKSFHIILAKFVKKMYNVIIIKREKTKKCSVKQKQTKLKQKHLFQKKSKSALS